MDQNQMMMDYLLGMAEMKPEQETLAKKQAMVDMLRQQSMQSPGMRGNGRLQVAANPLEFLNQGFQGYAARQGQGEADAMAKDYQGRRTGMLKNLQAKQMVGQNPNLMLPEQDINPYGM